MRDPVGSAIYPILQTGRIDITLLEPRELKV
jgi:hypothetical protein